MKVISFSLWGNTPMYTIGAIRNVDLAKYFYPDFKCWIYVHKDTVPTNIINELQKKANVKIIFKSGDLNISKPMLWRFEAIDDPSVDIMISRDTDTRILLREKLAVDEWLASDKSFHIMRDHPHHYDLNYKINAGMFGTKKINIPSWINVINNIKNIGKFTDQLFLNECIYPIIKNDCLVHTSFNIYPNENSKRFPIPYDNEYKFVGEYVYEDESRSLPHINILKNSL